MRFTKVGLIVLMMCAASVLRAQTPAFEAASIKPLPPAADGGVHIHMSDDDKMVNYSSVGLKDVMAYAYGVGKDQISGPAWLDNDMYAIVAKVPAGVSGKQIPAMLETLLRERFGMVIHRESRDVAVFALLEAKGGAKLKVADGATGCHGTGDSKGYILACQTSLAHFADWLSRQTGRPVIDKTQLDGPFAINMDWLPDAPDDPPNTALFEALNKQLGLRLEGQHAPREFIVVDSANRVPTEN
jgi:uncharacterized protein (TIGR03435 family)